MFQNENDDDAGTLDIVVGHKYGVDADDDGAVDDVVGATIRVEAKYDDDDDIANNDNSLSLLRATAPGVSTHIT